MLYDTLLEEFQEALGIRQLTTPDFQTEIAECHALCTETLTQLRTTVIQEGFESTMEEIRFFRDIKVVPMSYLIYYTEVSSYLINRPKNDRDRQLEYVRMQVARVDQFLDKQTEFLIYYRMEQHHLDAYYFTREHLQQHTIMHRYPYLKDKEFDTDKGFVLAKIQGWGMYVSYLQNEQRRLEYGVEPKTRGERKKLRYTDNPIEAAELIYTLVAAESFNHGDVKISDVVRAFSDIMGLDPKTIYRKLNDIKNRKDKVIYLDKLKAKFLRWLDDQDAL